jgi:hypothetical protein
MTSRSHEGRRRSTRSPGIWRGPNAPAEDRPPVQHGERERALIGWRFFSGIIIIGLVSVLFLFFNADIFYVHSIAVGGLQYMTKEEVFALSEIANMHIFWVDPQEVRKSILRSPTIADATVSVGWPPNMVQIIIEERQPALVWEQAGIATWIDVQGRVMQQRENRPELLRIQTDSMMDEPLSPNVRIDPDAVTGALQLKTLYPNIEVLRYHPEKGLGYADGRGWSVWFGSGTDMPEKILVYNAIVNNLLSRNIYPVEIDLSNLDAPFYSVQRGR